MVIHPHVKDARIEWVVEEGQWDTELVIVTDLETRPDAKGFLETEFNSMVEAAISHFATSNHRRVRIMPVG